MNNTNIHNSEIQIFYMEDLIKKAIERKIKENKISSGEVEINSIELLEFLDTFDYRIVDNIILGRVLLPIISILKFKKEGENLFAIEPFKYKNLTIRHLFIFAEIYLYLHPYMINYFKWFTKIIPLDKRTFVTDEEEFLYFCNFFGFKVSK